MNFRALKSNPSAESFAINSSCGMQSKAFDKSNEANKAPNVPLSTLFFHFFNHCNKAMLNTKAFSTATVVL